MLRFKSSAVRTVFLPMAISSVRGQTEEQTSCHTFSSGAGPPEGIHRHCGHLGLLNHGKLGSANDEGSHLRIILNHCI